MMPVGFTIVASDQGVEFRFFGPDAQRRSRLIKFHQFGDLAVCLFGRLHYRQERLQALEGQAPAELLEDCRLDDAALALAMYRSEGTRGLARLEGDYTLVCFDGRLNRLIGLRDPVGAYPQFWAQSGGTIALGTSIRTLLPFLPHRSLNLEYVADFLELPGCGFQEVPREHCAFEGVHRLLPGRMLTVELSTGRIGQELYWDWQERIHAPQAGSPRECAEQFAERLWAAVRERLCGQTASHFSGGFDSTGVALIADELLRQRGRRLHALSLIYEQLPELARETEYVDAALDGRPNIRSHRLLGDTLLDFSDYHGSPLYDEPFAGQARVAMDRGLARGAAAAGAQTILTGQGADEVINLPPELLVSERLRRGHVGEAWQMASEFGVAGSTSPWTILRQAWAGLMPAAARDGWRVMVRRGHADWRHQTDRTIAPWFDRGFARRFALRARALEYARGGFADCRSPVQRFQLDAIVSAHGNVSSWYLAAPHEMVITHPFFDPRLIALALGMPSQFKAVPGRQKPVLADALGGLLPEKVRHRRRKGQFGEVYFHGLSRHLTELEAMVRHAPVDDLQIIDKAKVVECLHQAALGICSDASGLDRLNLTLAFLSWFSRQREWLGEPEPVRERIRWQRHGGRATKSERPKRETVV